MCVIQTYQNSKMAENWTNENREQERRLLYM